MPEQKIEVAAAEGNAEGYLYTPDGKGPWPGLLFLTDIFGIRPANQAMARRIADAGYAVLVPNIFYRSHKLPIIDFEFKFGEEHSMKVLHALVAALDADQMKRDDRAYVDFLLARPEVEGGKLGAVGYCFSGKMALFAASEAPDKVAVAASFHGGHLVTADAASPHSEIPKVKAELYFGHAVEDASMTPQDVEKLDATLKAWGGKWQSEVYEGARHGWAVPGRDVYDEKQAERAHAKLVDLLGRNL